MEISANAFSTGLGGIQAGQRRVEQAASDIAGNSLPAREPQSATSQALPSSAVNGPDLAQSLAELSQGRNEVQASARVVETADAVLGTLIDIRA